MILMNFSINSSLTIPPTPMSHARGRHGAVKIAYVTRRSTLLINSISKTEQVYANKTVRVVGQAGPFRVVLACYPGSAEQPGKKFLVLERRRTDELGGEAWSEILVASPGSSCAENHAEYLREMADALLVDWPESEEEA